MDLTPTPHRHPRRLAAILFSDIRGYSAQMGRDEDGTVDRLEEHNRVWREEVARHNGRVVKTIGDAFMVEFSSSVDAVGCGLAVQRRLARHNQGRRPENRIDVRVGVHAGDVVVKDGDLLGDAVNLAARLEGQAPVGTVCVSSAVLEQVEGKVQATVADLGERSLKNMDRPLRLFALAPSEARLERRPSGSHPTRPGGLRPALLAAAAVVLAGAVGGVAWRWAQVPASRPERAGAEVPLRGGTLRMAIRGATVPPFQMETNTQSMTSLVLDMIMQTMAAPEDAPHDPDAWRIFTDVKVAPDGKALDLTLKENVRFHDQPCTGNVVRAAQAPDVVYSLEVHARGTLMDAPLVGLAEFLDGKSPHIQGVQVTGPRSVHLEFSQRMAFPAGFLASAWLLPREIQGCENLQDMKRPVSAGPFKLLEMQGDTVRLGRFAGFGGTDGAGGALPYLDALEMRPVAEDARGFADLRDGRLDLLVMGVDDARPHVVAEGPGRFAPTAALKAAGIKVASVGVENGREVNALWFLPAQKGPFQDPRVRRAVGHALRRERYLDGNALSQQAAMDRLLRPGDVGFDPAAPALIHNLPESRRLLREAGYPDGKGLPELVMAHGNEDRALVQQLQEDLRAVGIRLRGMVVSEADVDRLVDSQTVDLLGMTLQGYVVERDPWRYLHEIAITLRSFGHASDRMNELVHQIMSEPDRAARGRLCEQLEWLMLVDAAVIPLRGSVRAPLENIFAFFFFRDNVRGLVDPLTGTVPRLSQLRRAWLSDVGARP